MISSSVALAQNFLLTTESKLANIVNLSKNLAIALILIVLILPIIYFINFSFSSPLKIFCIFLGCLSVVINQYLSSYLVKKHQKRYLDILNGGLFSIGILLISWSSFYYNNIIIIMSSYIILECLMGINSYFFGIKKYEV